MAAILCVDDEPAVGAVLDRVLRELGHEPILASGVTDAIQALSHHRVDLVIADCVMPGRDGFDLLNYLHQEGFDVPTIAMSGYATGEHEERATGHGAVDFITKPLRVETVRIAVRSALTTHRLRRLSDEANREISQLRGASAVVGTSEPIREILEAIGVFAPTSNPILLHGEPGSGKTLFAREIHARSSRFEQPFVVVNCVDFSPSPHESRGGAAPAGIEWCAFHRATHGTLLLEEIGELSLTDQSKLLRVLQGREIETEGARAFPADVRVIATTRLDLAGEVAAGRFNRELYERLSAAAVRTPPLREHLEDIPALAAHFGELNATKLAIKAPPIPPETLDYLKRRPWPGNVRELANAIERGMIQQPGAVLTPEAIGRTHGPASTQHAAPSHAQSGGAESPAVVAASGEVLDLRKLERIAIHKALETTGGHKTKAAELLGINERTLRNKLRAEPIQVWVSKGPGAGPTPRR